MTPQVFISYSHQDEAWKDRIQAHLGVLARQGLLSVWDDRQIQAGQDWLPAIEQSMASCRVALLLISVDFLNSRFIESQEVPALLKRRQAEGVRVIPVILEPCAWPHVAWLRGIQARPRDGKALSGMIKHDADLAMVSLVDEIAGLLAAKPTPAPPAQKAQDTAPAQQAASVPPAVEPPPPGLRPLPAGLRRLAYALPAAAMAAALWWLGQRQLPLPPAGEASPSGKRQEPPPAATLPRDLPKACVECPEMAELPRGEFMMGSPDSENGRGSDEGPQRLVKIDYGFAVGKYEVTFAEWDACRRDNNACPPADDQGWGRDKRPVINVSWDDAQHYIAWLNRKAGLGSAAKDRYRLLSEAEWEYAARAGTTAAYWWGDSASHEQANYGKDVCCGGLVLGRDQWVYTAPVGSFPANPWRLHDMQGNVWEWTQDCYHGSYSGAPDDGSAWDGGTNCDGGRVLRGGSWNLDPLNLRSADRFRGGTGDRDNDIGFRLARTLTP